jgi:hypothetical protein
MGDLADDLMDRMETYCDEWCEGCATCADNTQWVTKDGVVWTIKDLETRHLVNILNYITNQGVQGAVGSARMENLRREAVRRGCGYKAGVWRTP